MPTQAAGSVLSAVMFDIDHFKQINDTYGHSGGDDALCALATQAAQRLSDSRPARRRGICNTARRQGTSRRRRNGGSDATRRAGIKVKSGNHTISLTCSFGVSQWESGDTIDRLLKRADVALYKAKKNGRNCVVSDVSVLDETIYDNLGSVIRVPMHAIYSRLP